MNETSDLRVGRRASVRRPAACTTALLLAPRPATGRERESVPGAAIEGSSHPLTTTVAGFIDSSGNMGLENKGDLACCASLSAARGGPRSSVTVSVSLMYRGAAAPALRKELKNAAGGGRCTRVSLQPVSGRQTATWDILRQFRSIDRDLDMHSAKALGIGRFLGDRRGTV